MLRFLTKIKSAKMQLSKSILESFVFESIKNVSRALGINVATKSKAELIDLLLIKQQEGENLASVFLAGSEYDPKLSETKGTTDETVRKDLEPLPNPPEVNSLQGGIEGKNLGTFSHHNSDNEEFEEFDNDAATHHSQGLGSRGDFLVSRNMPVSSHGHLLQSPDFTAGDRKIKMAMLNLEMRKLELDASARRSQMELELEKEKIHAGVQMKQIEFQIAQMNEVHVKASEECTPKLKIIQKKLLPDFSEKSPHEFFDSFEEVAFLNDWDQEVWARSVPIKFVGKALTLYREIPRENRDNYQLIRQVILAGYGHSSEVYRQEFRNMNKSYTDTYVDYSYKLKQRYNRWIESLDLKDDFESLKKVFLFEKFKEGLPVETLVYLNQGEYSNVFELAKSVDELVA